MDSDGAGTKSAGVNASGMTASSMNASGLSGARKNGPHMNGAREDVDYAHRHFVNLAATALLLLVATLGVWAIKTIDDQEALRKCLGAGRRDCVKIAAPPSGVVQPVR
jgi:hypothetical protein